MRSFTFHSLQVCQLLGALFLTYGCGKVDLFLLVLPIGMNTSKEIPCWIECTTSIKEIQLPPSQPSQKITDQDLIMTSDVQEGHAEQLGQRQEGKHAGTELYTSSDVTQVSEAYLQVCQSKLITMTLNQLLTHKRMQFNPCSNDFGGRKENTEHLMAFLAPLCFFYLGSDCNGDGQSRSWLLQPKAWNPRASSC